MKRDGYGRHARSVVRTDRPHTVTVDVTAEPAAGTHGADSAPLASHELKALFGRMASQRIPIVVLRAHDRAAREDIDQLIEHAAGLRLRVGLDLGGSWADAALGEQRERDERDERSEQREQREQDEQDERDETAAALRDALRAHRAAGLDQVEVELELEPAAERVGASSTRRLLQLVDDAHALDLAVGVRTPLAADATSRIRETADLLADHGVESWQISFFDRRPAAAAHASPSAPEVHAAFPELYRIECEGRIALTVVEAPHYRRYRIEQERSEASRSERDARRTDTAMGAHRGEVSDASVRRTVVEHCGVRADIGVRRHVADAGRPCLFIDRGGEAYPSERLLISAGNVRERALIDIYRNSDVFTLLRDVEALEGKCSLCGFRRVCGGSRARAWHRNGDCMGTDPACAFRPTADADDEL